MRLVGINPRKFTPVNEMTDGNTEEMNLVMNKVIKAIGKKTSGPSHIFNRRYTVDGLNELIKQMDEMSASACFFLNILLKSKLKEEFVVIFDDNEMNHPMVKQPWYKKFFGGNAEEINPNMKLRLVGIEPRLVNHVDGTLDKTLNKSIRQCVKLLGEKTNGPSYVFNKKEGLSFLQKMSGTAISKDAIEQVVKTLKGIKDNFVVIFDDNEMAEAMPSMDSVSMFKSSLSD